MLARDAYTPVDDHTLLCEAVRAAGQLGLALLKKGVRRWEKADGTPVSNADLEVNRLLHEHLAQGRPEYGWLSEESGDDLSRLSRSRVWIVDPIDGTRAFLRGEPHWTVSAALVEDGKPVLAAVYNPERERFYDAFAGGGARCNGDTIQVSARDEIEGCRILMKRSVARRDDWPEPWPDMHMELRNSMAYRLCLVAAGRFDAALAIGRTSEWDVAAADLLVSEAGGTVSAHDGSRFTYNREHTRLPNVLAAGPGLYEQMLRRTRGRPVHQTG